ncbi:MAG TPA: hypothetical protein VGD63_18250 [Steroidobacteraceae bacterium]
MKTIPCIMFVSMLLFAIFYVTGSVSNLPLLVASHFDGNGDPNAYMPRKSYTMFVLISGVGLPLAIVALLTAVYSKARDMKLPNRDYWLAPERIAQTRALLVNHGVWFGTTITAMVCFMHWLELDAHRTVPPHLSSQLFAGGLAAFLLITLGWIFVLLRAFRLPRA